MKITVRQATKEDIGNLLPLTRAFHHASNNKAYAEWNNEKWAKWLSACIEMKNLVCLMGTNGDSYPLGYLTGLIAPAYWDEDITFAQEASMWVVPEYRAQGIGKALIDAFTEWGKENNCILVAAGTTQSMSPKKTAIWYKKQGFALDEKVFIRRL
jgi:GNAT superfamily N-acetyltransferase